MKLQIGAQYETYTGSIYTVLSQEKGKVLVSCGDEKAYISANILKRKI